VYVPLSKSEKLLVVFWCPRKGHITHLNISTNLQWSDVRGVNCWLHHKSCMEAKLNLPDFNEISSLVSEALHTNGTWLELHGESLTDCQWARSCHDLKVLKFILRKIIHR
jgi:hypothetical protein